MTGASPYRSIWNIGADCITVPQTFSRWTTTFRAPPAIGFSPLVRLPLSATSANTLRPQKHVRSNQNSGSSDLVPQGKPNLISSRYMSSGLLQCLNTTHSVTSILKNKPTFADRLPDERLNVFLHVARSYTWILVLSDHQRTTTNVQIRQPIE